MAALWPDGRYVTGDELARVLTGGRRVASRDAKRFCRPQQVFVQPLTVSVAYDVPRMVDYGMKFRLRSRQGFEQSYHPAEVVRALALVCDAGGQSFFQFDIESQPAKVVPVLPPSARKSPLLITLHRERTQSPSPTAFNCHVSASQGVVIGEADKGQRDSPAAGSIQDRYSQYRRWPPAQRRAHRWWFIGRAYRPHACGRGPPTVTRADHRSPLRIRVLRPPSETQATHPMPTVQQAFRRDAERCRGETGGTAVKDQGENQSWTSRRVAKSPPQARRSPPAATGALHYSRTSYNRQPSDRDCRP
ncbi:hypothetical protein J2848_003823 [Azospirillum lipoferum]|nr:hypothetical protein [Azospirillum lipoferum]